MENLAGEIVRRANRQNISINKLCRAAGVSRRWFEYLKRRTPKAVEAYLKINQCLTDLETKHDGNNYNTGKAERD